MIWARVVLLSLVIASPASATTFSGVASVVDADTLEIHGQRIRLHGIDALEGQQTCFAPEPTRCGQQAALALSDYLQRRTVTCKQTDIDRYKRVVARCSVGGQDIALWLVQNGHALDYARYSKGEYAQAEKAAKASRRGMWSMRFALPWEWRRDRSAPLVN